MAHATLDAEARKARSRLANTQISFNRDRVDQQTLDKAKADMAFHLIRCYIEVELKDVSLTEEQLTKLTDLIWGRDGS